MSLCPWPCPGPLSSLQIKGPETIQRLITRQTSVISDSLKPTSVSTGAPFPLPSPRSRAHRSLQRIFIYNAKKIINHFWTVLISVKQLIKNVATPLREVLVCVDLLGTVCMAQDAGCVFVQKKASPWHPDGQHHGPGVSKNV